MACVRFASAFAGEHRAGLSQRLFCDALRRKRTYGGAQRLAARKLKIVTGRVESRTAIPIPCEKFSGRARGKGARTFWEHGSGNSYQ